MPFTCYLADCDGLWQSGEDKCITLITWYAHSPKLLRCPSKGQPKKYSKNWISHTGQLGLQSCLFCCGHPIRNLYRTKHVVIGPANHAYIWVAFAEKGCTAWVLRIYIPMPQGGLRKGGTFGAWLPDPPN